MSIRDKNLKSRVKTERKTSGNFERISKFLFDSLKRGWDTQSAEKKQGVRDDLAETVAKRSKIASFFRHL